MVLHKKLEKLLLEAGLSEQEVLVYISLLKNQHRLFGKLYNVQG